MATGISPDDLLITPELYRREARPADLRAELNAYRELSTLMDVGPAKAIDRFLELALELCPAAGSAGLSELVSGEGGEAFEWTAMNGAFAPHVGGTTPRDFSPCGLCLDRHHTILVERPARVFTYFDEAQPAICEGLIVPLYDTGKQPLGTLWIVSHVEDRCFDPTDARIMEQLAVQLVLAIKLRRKAQIRVALEEAVRDREVLVEEVRHRVKNTIQMTSSLLRMHERSASSSEARSALRDARNRLKVLSSVYEKMLRPDDEGLSVEVGKLIDSLVFALVRTAPAESRPQVQVDCANLSVDIKTATSLALVVNEAVTNSLKYAFASGPGGTLRVNLEAPADECSLVISDDGVGFDGSGRSGSLGMRLMNGLARQLDGRLSIDGSDGTTVALRCPLRRSSWTSPEAQAQVQRVAAG
ncbi:histidine kinase dimerization/phosphoacceptor domain -containing protein [Croceibacterium aestuarii]|uniref:histidine kinase dimerization/phosphoacceptor domain -containing protein n=1 Tax=Croceibacterium aestuarii TaxID=3064139 RepID=UPI00272E7498|nr:histidine kinase dimerization/phosphoacceptor domain -containing protein [Croceibacterium sp. D39]